jgi:hypothetical protein
MLVLYNTLLAATDLELLRHTRLNSLVSSTLKRGNGHCMIIPRESVVYLKILRNFLAGQADPPGLQLRLSQND